MTARDELPGKAKWRKEPWHADIACVGRTLAAFGMPAGFMARPFSDLNAGVASLAAGLDETDARIDETNARLDRTNERLVEIALEVEETKTRVTVLANDVRSLENRVTVLTNDKRSLESRAESANNDERTREIAREEVERRVAMRDSALPVSPEPGQARRRILRWAKRQHADEDPALAPEAREGNEPTPAALDSRSATTAKVGGSNCSSAEGLGEGHRRRAAADLASPVDIHGGSACPLAEQGLRRP